MAARRWRRASDLLFVVMVPVMLGIGVAVDRLGWGLFVGLLLMLGSAVLAVCVAGVCSRIAAWRVACQPPSAIEAQYGHRQPPQGGDAR
jgi:hypothetical protein